MAQRSRGLLVTAGLPVLGTVGIVFLWWAAIKVFDVPSYQVPTPGAVAREFGNQPGYLAEQAWVSGARRLEERMATMTAGVEDFSLWLTDLMRAGTLKPTAAPYAAESAFAARSKRWSLLWSGPMPMN